MSDMSGGYGAAQNVNNTLQNIAQQMGAWVAAFNGRIVVGSLTLSGGTTTTVPQPNVTANSFIDWNPTNGTAALTQKNAGLFRSAMTAGVGFALSTQSGTTFGTETFSYMVFNPS